MTEMTTCLQCGTPLPPGAAGGNCPRCLLAEGLRGESSPLGLTNSELHSLFPNLEISELIGHGGMGVVYKARQKNLDREIALKILQPKDGDHVGFSARFTREARTLARLTHPNIVTLHEFGESGELYYLLLEYVDGPNLREIIQSGGLQPKEALTIVPQICAALQYAHDQGVIHRDIKPENVLLDRSGQVRITDFGLAKLVGSSPETHTLTREGQVLGTWHYMAPEQYQAPNLVDHRADIYSLGVVFYEMLTGQLPVGSFTPPSVQVQVDVRLDKVVKRALAQDKDKRFQHASDIADDVAQISASPRTRPSARFKRTETKSTRVSQLAVLSFVTLPVSILWLMSFGLFCYVSDLDIEREEDFARYVLLAILMLGVIGGLASMIRIALSQGGLRGMGWATTAVIGGFGLAIVFADTDAPPREAHRPKYTLFSETDSSEARADERAEINTFLGKYWARVKERGSTAVTREDPHFEDILDFYSESDRSKMKSLGESQLTKMIEEESGGLPLFDLKTLPHSFDRYAVDQVEFTKASSASDSDLNGVEVSLRWNDSTLRFPMSKENGRWGFRIGHLVLGKKSRGS